MNDMNHNDETIEETTHNQVVDVVSPPVSTVTIVEDTPEENTSTESDDTTPSDITATTQEQQPETIHHHELNGQGTTETLEPATTTSAETPADSVEPAADRVEPAADRVEPAADRVEPAADRVEPAADRVETPEESATTEPSTDSQSETPQASYTPRETKNHPRRLKDLQVGMCLQGKVTSVALYGVFVDIGLGRDGLVHISEMSDERIESPADLVQIGDGVTVWVKKVDIEDRRISLTMREPREGEEEEEEQQQQQERGRPPRRNEPDQEALAQLKVNDIVTGKITGLAPFGAFVDIGVGKDGLVHISELSENRVEKPEDAVQVGKEYTFKILEVDSEGNRISLSLRRAQRSQRMLQLSPGDIVEGSVSGLAPFGAFVDIGVGRDGLVHISQISNERVEKVEDIVKVGETIKVRVLEVDSQSKRISLTMRLEDPPAEPEPQEEPPAIVDEAETSSSIEEPEPLQAEPTPPPPPPRKENRREGKGRQRGRGSRTQSTPARPNTEVYATSESEPDEEFEGNATLEDLVMRFGGKTSGRKDRRRRNDDFEDDEDNRFQNRRKQRDAIQRTLQHNQLNDDE